MLTTLCMTLGAAPSASARWEPVDYFTTPARAVYCELWQETRLGGNRLRCGPVGLIRSGRGRAYWIYNRGRVRSERLVGQPMEIQYLNRLRYNTWYSMTGGTPKVGRAGAAINCRVRRLTGLRCSNRTGHGFRMLRTRVIVF